MVSLSNHEQVWGHPPEWKAVDLLLMRVEGVARPNENPALEKVMLPIAVVATLLVWAAFVVRIIREPGNHVGPEPLLAIIPFAVVLAVAWLPRYRRWKAARSLVTGYVLLSVAALVAMDRANVLVEYERWVSPSRAPVGRFLSAMSGQGSQE